ncbi:diguanylate cyclase domain-containing protein [Methylotenera versatilis]|uniref:diguanylate cyclase domain-containing protein n=1 Tax=Methylotenera versatilis TaxID=1055487 RepID=UPI0006468F71|nr:diguanylate cyclase [Methylotenera versatilis]
MNMYRLMKYVSYLKNNSASFAYAFLIFIIFASIFELLVSAEYEKAEARVTVEATDYANALKTKVDRELNALLFVSNGLSSYLTVYHQHLDSNKLSAILADLYVRTKHVRNLGVAVGYKLTYVYPVKSNEKSIGIDYRDITQQWPQVKQAVDSREGVLAGPLDLVQGGRGLIYRYPIFVDGQYWGLLSTVINTDSFFKAAFHNLTDDEFDFAIRVKGSSTVFYGNPSLFQNPKALISVSDLPNVQWEWAVLQKAEKTPELILITRLMSIAISLLLATLAYFFLSERKTLTSQAMQDSLTGLANRRLLDFRMAQTFAQSKRFNRLMAIMYIDIDHFKKLNDSYGHDVGDELLKIIAKKLNHCIRDVDILSRVGGDEFVIVLDELNHIDDANLIADKIMASFEKNITVMNKTIKVSVSIGIAGYQKNSEETLNSLMKKADIALYEAKASGRNIYKIYPESRKI